MRELIRQERFRAPVQFIAMQTQHVVQLRLEAVDGFCCCTVPTTCRELFELQDGLLCASQDCVEALVCSCARLSRGQPCSIAAELVVGVSLSRAKWLPLSS